MRPPSRKQTPRTDTDINAMNNTPKPNYASLITDSLAVLWNKQRTAGESVLNEKLLPFPSRDTSDRSPALFYPASCASIISKINTALSRSGAVSSNILYSMTHSNDGEGVTSAIPAVPFALLYVSLLCIADSAGLSNIKVISESAPYYLKLTIRTPIKSHLHKVCEMKGLHGLLDSICSCTERLILAELAAKECGFELSCELQGKTLSFNVSSGASERAEIEFKEEAVLRELDRLLPIIALVLS